MSSCTVCSKAPPAVTLKQCAKCSTTPYCSRECQKQDWKSHRKICGSSGSASASGSTSGSTSSSSGSSSAKGLEWPVSDPFTRLTKDTYLHRRPRGDVYRLLIDAYRLRACDEHTFDIRTPPGSLYGGAPHAQGEFERFLDTAEQTRGLLPPWWTSETRAECIALGMGTTPGEWANLRKKVDKAAIIARYGNPQFPMQLRVFAERVIGTGIAGANGMTMATMLAATESGDMVSSTLDMSSLMGGRG